MTKHDGGGLNSVQYMNEVIVSHLLLLHESMGGLDNSVQIIEDGCSAPSSQSALHLLNTPVPNPCSSPILYPPHPDLNQAGNSNLIASSIQSPTTSTALDLSKQPPNGNPAFGDNLSRLVPNCSCEAERHQILISIKITLAAERLIGIAPSPKSYGTMAEAQMHLFNRQQLAREIETDGVDHYTSTGKFRKSPYMLGSQQGLQEAQ
ncbi:hypothetical protein L873DRAFT_1793348 [Choiromyces venosus 120613-1]|uniref:Uncharacterized protein n=1 Tax=Choiromyces venosus 120613-1 TaxID=1336337 RepID=A0A3N4JA86_9PEZI|nr:hypothetical protein L873DRAFT_1793348 [Choiromyces venosus 120613-1]